MLGVGVEGRGGFTLQTSRDWWEDGGVVLVGFHVAVW